ncbi:histidine triad nucleotide-binding protein [Bacteroidota bacterium]
MSDTIFSKIIKKQIPAEIVYETEDILGFKDINPQAPIHILIIPKIEISTIKEINATEHAALLGKMFDAANDIAKENDISEEGFRLVINCGNNGGQEVYHLHMHLLGGRKMKWPPG